ncbi:MBL fold metallo-hydrolase [Sphingosinicella ginsenosidimutans]|uniref:MBL fold metallo-hydrolase n=1 Tax=Allosphingosinicella ginsenosidimutans TaxID=1176539 RepID=A0A5C6TYD7_9SPHN|nr:MBL fold metallo-hydrolase [Sphingosinicella ginsenosidimutans]TXC64738.1 MBL fold metallo-hydrolase [Sphingosinicella ginsenosidimutans]
MARMAEPPYERAEEVAPGVRRILAGNPSPFTFEGTETYLVGTAEIAVIDPGPDDPRHVDAILAAVGGGRVSAILCTHTHRDHSPASRALAEATGAPIIGCAPLAISDDGPRADAAFDFDYAPDRVLKDGDTLEGEGWRLAAVATPGHTSNHLCFAFGDILFTGDHVMGWSTTVIAPPDGDMADYMASLDRLLARDDRLYFPAHGPAVEKPRAHVRALITHRRMREKQILERLGQGIGRIPAMVETMYRAVDPRLHPAAGRSVLAHLIDLERRGLIGREGEEWTLRA